MKRYSIWSNYCFTFIPLWKQKRRIALCFLAAAVLFVAAPVTGMMITSMLVGSLEAGISMQRFVCRALLAFAGYGVLSMAKGYLEARNDGQYIEARTELFLMDWIEKDLTISMEQYEDAEIHKLKKKAEDCIWANEWGIYASQSGFIEKCAGAACLHSACGKHELENSGDACWNVCRQRSGGVWRDAVL